MVLNWPLLSAGLLLASLGGFAWAMRKFFSQPSGDTAGMRLIRACSTGFALLHLGAILATPDVTARQVLLGAFVYVSALAIFVWAIRANRESPLSAAFSTDTPRHLNDRGPYRFIRHPFYCAYLMTWMAGFIATRRWWLLPSVAVMLLVYRRAAKIEEEKFAASPLASAYRHYQESTGQFLPNPLAWTRARRKETDAARLA